MKRAAPAPAATVAALRPDPPPTHNAKKCTCLKCDPMQARAQKARERWAEERAAAAKLKAELAALPRPAVLAKSAPRYTPPTNETRRLAELLRAGKTSREAIEIIESENAQRKGTP